MNILVLHSQVPFTRGGAEVLVEGLVDALRDRDHRAEIVSLPLTWNPVDRLLTSAVAWGLLDLSTFNGVDVDLVICTKFPTWAVRHPRKVLWLIHQHRQAYDLHASPLSEFTPSDEARAVRKHVMEIDRRGIYECLPRFAISENVATRLKRFNGLDATALYPPVPRTGLRPESFDPFILCLTRLDDAKRVDLAIRAWCKVEAGLKLVIAGDGPALPKLEALVKDLGLQSRVEFRGRISDEQVVDLYNRCRGVIYTPVDEDYGYAAVEALAAGKPVITTIDSGGILEFVRNDETGLVTTTEPLAIARSVDMLADEFVARRLGSGGPVLTSQLNWDNVVTSLLGTPRG